jgi:3'-phosphoadenosine 5'-phosphosulfate sulfotransferase (PAPS reductase)/FAD synthetase
LQIQDRINLIYTDTPYAFDENFKVVSTYADKLKAAVNTALEEEAVLITVLKIYHAE